MFNDVVIDKSLSIFLEKVTQLFLFFKKKDNINKNNKRCTKHKNIFQI